MITKIAGFSLSLLMAQGLQLSGGITPSKPTYTTTSMAVRSVAGSPQDLAGKVLAATTTVYIKNGEGELADTGSGFVIAPGIVVTNRHVINGGYSGYVMFGGQQLAIASVIAVDAKHDLALLLVPGANVTPLPMDNKEDVRIGDTVYVAGSPLGLDGTFSEGMISSFRSDSNGDQIQMTAPVSHGNSGGPVVNSRGQVIAITVASYAEGQNLNIAIPVRYLRALVQSAQITTT